MPCLSVFFAPGPVTTIYLYPNILHLYDVHVWYMYRLQVGWWASHVLTMANGPCQVSSLARAALRSIEARPKDMDVGQNLENTESWWFMMIYDDLWWFMMIYDDLWWFMMIYDDLWWFMMIYDDLWMVISNYKVVCVGLVIQMGCYSHPKVSTIPCFFGRELQGTRLLSHPGGHDFLTWYNHIQQINKMGQIKWYNQSAKLDLTSGIGIWTSKKDLAG
jgi:hypothetical protein